jgi:hypothetical protein
MALHRAGQADAERVRREVAFAALRVNGRLRDECLNETLFTSLAHARFVLDVSRDDYNQVRPHSKLGGKPPSGSPAHVSGGMPPDTLPPSQTPIMKERDSTFEWHKQGSTSVRSACARPADPRSMCPALSLGTPSSRSRRR